MAYGVVEGFLVQPRRTFPPLTHLQRMRNAYKICYPFSVGYLQLGLTPTLHGELLQERKNITSETIESKHNSSPNGCPNITTTET